MKCGGFKILQVSFGRKLLRPPALAPAESKSLISRKGWRMADVALRWNVRPETLSRVAADPTRETRSDDAVRALPTLLLRERARPRPRVCFCARRAPGVHHRGIPTIH